MFGGTRKLGGNPWTSAYFRPLDRCWWVLFRWRAKPQMKKPYFGHFTIVKCDMLISNVNMGEKYIFAPQNDTPFVAWGFGKLWGISIDSRKTSLTRPTQLTFDGCWKAGGSAAGTHFLHSFGKPRVPHLLTSRSVHFAVSIHYRR